MMTLVLSINLTKLLNLKVVSFFATSFAPPQIITKSFCVKLSVSDLSEEVIANNLAFGFIIPVTLYEFPSKSAIILVQPHVAIS